jgi:biopolymer transport protein ExbB/TolQ
MTTRHQLFLALLAIAGLFPSAVAFAVAWFRTNRRLRELEARFFGPPPSREDRTARLERVVDTLAVQLDQVVSGQEFLNRVLTEKLGRPRLEAPDEVTPS